MVRDDNLCIVGRSNMSTGNVSGKISWLHDVPNDHPHHHARWLKAKKAHRKTTVTNETKTGDNLKNIKIGQRVAVVQKQDQRTGKLTEGVVQRILTKSATHPHGIKVQLVSGVVGRVKSVLG